MTSIETGAPPQATTETQITWSSKLSRYISSSIIGAVEVRNHGKVDVTLRLFMCVFSLGTIIALVTSKQTESIRVSPNMTIDVDAKFTSLPSFTYLVAAFSVVWLYSIITGYSSFSAMKKQQRSSLVLLDSLILSISASATGAAGGVAYEATKGNTHLHWMKICHNFDTFCHHAASAEVMSLLTTITLLMLVWFSVCATEKNNGG